MSITWKKTIRDIFIAICVGLIYYCIVRFTGLGFECFYYKATGLPCPSCGITRMFLSLSKLDFVSAFHYNQFFFFTWPLLAAECVYVDYKIEDHKDIPKWNVILLIITGIALIIFGTLRNLYLL